MIEILKRTCLTDKRGTFLKVLTGLEEGAEGCGGEIYVVTGVPGARRGGHYHPIATEWFTVIVGAVEFAVENPKTRTRRSMVVSSEEPTTIRVDAGVAHQLIFDEKLGGTVVAYSSEKYSPTDTIPYSFDAE